MKLEKYVGGAANSQQQTQNQYPQETVFFDQIQDVMKEILKQRHIIMLMKN